MHRPPTCVPIRPPTRPPAAHSLTMPTTRPSPRSLVVTAFNFITSNFTINLPALPAWCCSTHVDPTHCLAPSSHAPWRILSFFDYDTFEANLLCRPAQGGYLHGAAGKVPCSACLFCALPTPLLRSSCRLAQKSEATSSYYVSQSQLLHAALFPSPCKRYAVHTCLARCPARLPSVACASAAFGAASHR